MLNETGRKVTSKILDFWDFVVPVVPDDLYPTFDQNIYMSCTGATATPSRSSNLIQTYFVYHKYLVSICFRAFRACTINIVALMDQAEETRGFKI